MKYVETIPEITEALTVPREKCVVYMPLSRYSDLAFDIITKFLTAKVTVNVKSSSSPHEIKDDNHLEFGQRYVTIELNHPSITKQIEATIQRLESKYANSDVLEKVYPSQLHN